MLQRLKVDDIVHPDDRVKAREYECPICMGIPPTSSVVLTACCNNITCTECIAPLEACPNCRTGFEGDGTKTVPLPPIVHRILHNIKVVCPFSHTARDATGPENSSSSNDIQATGGGGICNANCRGGGGSSEPAGSCCDWTGNYGDLLTKHIAECAYAEIDCPHGCGERFLRGQLSTHEEGCEKGYEECGICGVMVKIGGMAGHRAEAAEMHVKILEADRADLRAQVAERDALQTKVDGVRAEVDEIKTMNADLFKLIGVNGLGPRVSWKVKTSEMFEKCKKKGDIFKSPEFPVGMSEFSISFVALGEKSASQDTKAGLFLEQTRKELYFPGGAQVVVSAAADEFAPVSRHFSWKNIFDSPRPYGYSGFINISDLRKAPEIVISLRHADGDNGCVIEIGGPTDTHSTSTDRTLDVFRAESQSFKEEIREGLAGVVNQVDGVVNQVDAMKAELKQEMQPRDMTDVLGVLQALSADVKAVQAEAKEREQLQTQKAAEARTVSLVSLGVTAVAVICLAIVVGRK